MKNERRGIYRNIKALYLFKKGITLLFMCTLLTPFLFLINSEKAEAAVDALQAEILNNLSSSNNSNTSTSNRLPVSVVNQPVNFVLAGQGGLSASVNAAGEDKFGVLTIPEELVNKVQPNGQATLQTQTTVDITRVPLLNTILTALDSLTNSLNLNLGIISINLTAVNQQISLLKTVGNLNNVEVKSDLTLFSNGSALQTNLSNSLGVILGSNVPTILQNLRTAIQNIEIRVIGIDIGGIVRALLQGLVNTLLNSVTSALNNIATVQQQLADAAVLGTTRLTIPTYLSGPNTLQTNYTANFALSIVKIKNIELASVDFRVLNTGNRITPVYFAPAVFGITAGSLPSRLDFGDHVIQSKNDELWRATSDGNQQSAAISSKLQITDTRAKTKKWQVKLKQASNWNTQQRFLTNAELRINLGNLQNQIPGSTATTSGKVITLKPNEEKTVVSLQETAAIGSLSLDLSSFELFVPKNTPKYTGKYQTTLVWTLSDSP